MKQTANSDPLEGRRLDALDWARWVRRWERMQERHVWQRAQRFALLADLIRDTQGPQAHILDLGCGPGSLMEALLAALPGAQVWGLDVDPTLLLLAERRLAPWGDRVSLLQRDLRDPSWATGFGPVEAVVSATALHWLTEERLHMVYGEIGSLLAPGGMFLNADHVRSGDARLQRAWEGCRGAYVSRGQADDWEGFWAAYLAELGDAWRATREAAIGPWEGSDEGLPLAWHLDALREQGLAAVDCFWRHDGDAIYGGFGPETQATPPPGHGSK